MAIGQAYRVQDPAVPAPYGHKNPRFCIFDSVGIKAIQDHRTELITSVSFQLVPVDCTIPCGSAFPGQLLVGNVPFAAGMAERDYPADATIELHRQLPGHYSARENSVYISVDTLGRRSARGRRTRVRYVTEVTICLS